MVSRFIAYGFALLLFQSVGFSEAMTTAKVGYFRPSSGILRDIYSSSWASFGLEGAGSFSETNSVLKRTYLTGKVNYMESHGYSKGFEDRTRIQIVPLSLGGRFLESFTNVAVPFDLYLGGGPSYFFVDVKNNSTTAKSRVNRSGLGGFTELGTFIRPAKHLLINFALGYSFKRLSPPGDSKACKTHSVEVGGFAAEGGVGYKF